MDLSLAKINFCFPKKIHRLRSKQKLVGLIINEMEGSGNIKYVGYSNKKKFQKDLESYVSRSNFIQYQPLSIKQKSFIKKNIHKTLKKCHQFLPHPDPPIFIFIYPWFPNTKKLSLFQGVTAFATYYTMHIFINPNNYSKQSLTETIAHEWNHLVFYRYHKEKSYNLRTYMAMEGMAEVFREEIVKGSRSPWTLALTEEETIRQFETLKSYLNKNGIGLYKKIFYGNKKYKQWTGYSIGYYFMKKFRNKHPKLSWKKIIRISSDKIIES